jgi:hypothetical protein
MIRVPQVTREYSMSNRLVVFVAMMGSVPACSDATGPSPLVVQGPKNAPTAQPDGPLGCRSPYISLRIDRSLRTPGGPPLCP